MTTGQRRNPWFLVPCTLVGCAAGGLWISDPQGLLPIYNPLLGFLLGLVIDYRWHWGAASRADAHDNGLPNPYARAAVRGDERSFGFTIIGTLVGGMLGVGLSLHTTSYEVIFWPCALTGLISGLLLDCLLDGELLRTDAS